MCVCIYTSFHFESFTSFSFLVQCHQNQEYREHVSSFNGSIIISYLQLDAVWLHHPRQDGHGKYPRNLLPF